MQGPGRQFDSNGSDVLVQTLELVGSRDGHDPRLLGQQPGKRDLSHTIRGLEARLGLRLLTRTTRSV